MKIESYQYPKSSFLGMEKDFALIVNQMLSNDRLKKLLFYADRNCLKLPNLTQEQTLGLINKQIKLVPKVEVDKELFTYIIISADDFLQNYNNEFRDSSLAFDIICHFDQWNLGDFKLRPYLIAGEIDSMFNNKKLTGIGTVQFVGARQIVLNDEFAGLSLVYQIIHGNEDKVE